jgi:hypothetical protein
MEFLPNKNALFCPPINSTIYPHAGDSITANVVLDTWIGGKDPSKVDVFIYDNNNSNIFCTEEGKKYFNSTIPIYNSFITEVPPLFTEPNFTKVTMTQNTVIYNGLASPISSPYQQGWFNEYNFFDPSFYDSVNNGFLIGQNFTETWNPFCVIPSSGNWTVPSTCTLNVTATAPANIIVPNGVVLRIPYGISTSTALKIDLIHNYLKINSGGGVLIDGSDNSSYPGGVIKCPTC